jgi:beta-lactamase regulating signal transducer with metallopeptidase domain
MNDFLSWLGLETGLNVGSAVSIHWGLTLLHFLWQGTIIGLVAFLAAMLLRHQSAVVRYWVHVMALLACPLCVAMTFALVEIPGQSQISTQSESAMVTASTTATDNKPLKLEDVPYPDLNPGGSASASNSAPTFPLTSPVTIPTQSPESLASSDTISQWLPQIAQWITAFYAAGVICFLVRLAVALRGGHRLRAISMSVSDSAFLTLIRDQAQSIGLKFVPVVAYCERVAVPTVIGVLRPMILLPATLTTGLSTEELSAILSHELAHIRRYDLWMNLLQRVIESLLFFHPVIWILSRRVSAEREICCDDLVVRSGHQPMNYAGALLRMAELCAGISPPKSLALAATSGGLTLLEHRVMRLIHQPHSSRLHLTRHGIALIAIVFLTSIVSMHVIHQLTHRTSGDDVIATTASAVNDFEIPEPAEKSKTEVSSNPVTQEKSSSTPLTPRANAGLPKEPDRQRMESFHIQGRVMNVKQQPIAGARIFLCAGPSDTKLELLETFSKDDGTYEFRNLNLPASPHIWSFELVATSLAHGFTWRSTRFVIPDTDPIESTRIVDLETSEIQTDFPVPDSPKHFFRGEKILMDLVFDEATMMRLRVVDDEGEPLVNTPVRLFEAEPVPGFIRERFGPDFPSTIQGLQLELLYRAGLIPPDLVSRTTDKDGWLEYSAMPRNCEFDVLISPSGFGERMVVATTGPPSQSKQQSQFRNGQEVICPRASDVNVSVLFGDTGKPAANVYISGANDNGAGSDSACTDEHGQVVLRIPSRKTTFQVIPEYLTPYASVLDGSVQLDVQKGSTNSLTISLPPVAEVDIHVVDAATGEPVSGVDLWALLPDKSQKRHYHWASIEKPLVIRFGPSSSDEHGITPTRFAPGKYTLGLGDIYTPVGYEPTEFAEAVHVEFKAGEKSTLTMKLKRKAAVTQVEARSTVLDVPVAVHYPHCILNIENPPVRPLVDAIATFNLTSQESPTGVLEQPITEQETRVAIAKFAAESHVPEAVRAQLNEILKSGSLPSNVYFRRFTRLDDGKEMHGVWLVRLVVETNDGPVYSVPVRSRFLYSRPYTQMERQQNAADGLTLINRVASYYEEPPVVVQPSDLPAASVETLIRKTQDGIKAEDDTAIGSLFESTGASETQREFAVSELRALSKARVHSIKVSPLKLKGEQRTWSAWQFYKPNLPVVAFLEIEYEDRDAATRRADAQPLAEERKVLSLELGLVGDELRLVNYVADGERTPPESLNPGPSITGHLEPLADGTHLVTDIITNPGTLLSAHLANEEIRQRDFRNASEQEE